MPEFFQTPMGMRLYEHMVPELVKQITPCVADALEAPLAKREGRAKKARPLAPRRRTGPWGRFLLAFWAPNSAVDPLAYEVAVARRPARTGASPRRRDMGDRRILGELRVEFQ